MAVPQKKKKSVAQVAPSISTKSRVSFNYIFYHIQDLEAAINKVNESITDLSSCFFISPVDQKLYNNKRNEVDLTVLNSSHVVFASVQSMNLGLELKTWAEKNTLKLSKTTTYSIGYQQSKFSTFFSDSLAVPIAFTKDLLEEASNVKISETLMQERLDLFRKSSRTVYQDQNEDIIKHVGNKWKDLFQQSFVTPFRAGSQLKSGTYLKFEHPWFKPLFYFLLIFAFIYCFVGAQNAGIMSDEIRYMGQAEKVFNFYKTFGKDTSSTIPNGIDHMEYSGQLLDNVPFFTGKLFGLEKSLEYRHLWSSIIAFLSILFSGLIGLRLSGYKLASYILLLLLCSPVFIGNGFNNLRDFAAVIGICLGVYGLGSSGLIFPNINWKYLIAIFFGMFIAGGQRAAGGVLMIMYLGLFSLLILLWNKKLNFNGFKDKLVYRWIFIIGSVISIGYLCSILVWPFGLINPIKNIGEALKFSNKVTVGLNQVFEGGFRISTNMPSHYLIKYLLITVPIGVLIGILLSVASRFNKLSRITNSYYWFFMFVFLFVITYAFFKLSTMYGSWRQFTFIYPFMVIVAAIGWDYLFDKIPKIKNSILSFVILFLLLAHPILYSFMNHPFEYLYYNEFLGGTKKALGNYEMDYAFNSLKQGSDWLKDYIQKNHSKGTKLVIATNSISEMDYYFKGFDENVTNVYTRYYERYSRDWDYAVFPNVYIHPYQLKNNIFPKGDSLHTIMVDGIPVCFIFKRNNREDFAAVQALGQNNREQGLALLQNYLKYNPKSEWAWFQSAYIYSQANNFTQAQSYLNESFKCHPEYKPTQVLQGLIYLNTNKPKEAQVFFQKVITEKYDLANSYFWSGQAYEAEKNYRQALTQFGFALGAGNKNKETYSKIALCFRQLGDLTQAAKYEAMAQ